MLLLATVQPGCAPAGTTPVVAVAAGQRPSEARCAAALGLPALACMLGAAKHPRAADYAQAVGQALLGLRQQTLDPLAQFGAALGLAGLVLGQPPGCDSALSAWTEALLLDITSASATPACLAGAVLGVVKMGLEGSRELLDTCVRTLQVSMRTSLVACACLRVLSARALELNLLSVADQQLVGRLADDGLGTSDAGARMALWSVGLPSAAAAHIAQGLAHADSNVRLVALHAIRNPTATDVGSLAPQLQVRPICLWPTITANIVLSSHEASCGA